MAIIEKCIKSNVIELRRQSLTTIASVAQGCKNNFSNYLDGTMKLLESALKCTDGLYVKDNDNNDDDNKDKQEKQLKQASIKELEALLKLLTMIEEEMRQIQDCVGQLQINRNQSDSTPQQYRFDVNAPVYDSQVIQEQQRQRKQQTQPNNSQGQQQGQNSNSNSVPFVPNLMMMNSGNSATMPTNILSQISRNQQQQQEQRASGPRPTQPPALPPSKDGKDNTRLHQRISQNPNTFQPQAHAHKY